MAKQKWLYCGYDWQDIVNIIKLTKNPNERLQEFNDLLRRENVTINDILEVWCVLEKNDIKPSTEKWFLDDSEVDNIVIYWFFNIYTGEALHIKYSINCTGIIKD